MERVKCCVLFILLFVAMPGYGTDNGNVMTGFVLNQDYEPVVGAKIEVGFYGKDVAVSALTDDYGHFLISLDGLKGAPIVSISADGYGERKLWGYQYSLTGAAQTHIFFICNAATFYAGQLASLMLPTAPDASLGQYYRLDKVQDKKLVFERERTPKADTPYLIIPDRDFKIDYSESLQTDKWVEQSFAEASFYGFYSPTTYQRYEKEGTFLVDKTPDCRYRYQAEHFPFESGADAGAMRALITLKSNGNWTNVDFDSHTQTDNWTDILVFHDCSNDSVFSCKKMESPSVRPQRTAFAGVVNDQAQKPLSGASVKLRDSDGSLVCETKTDEHGHFLLPISDSSKPYEVTVCEEGKPEQRQYRDGWQPFDFSQGSLAGKLSLNRKIVFEAGKRATIMLPTTPDPSLGCYYQLEKVENGKIVFYRELSPKANVPYLIIPDKNYEIDYDEIAMTGRMCEISVQGITLKGFYECHGYRLSADEYAILLDKTSDCNYIYESEHSQFDVGCRVGAMRAVLVLNKSVYKDVDYSKIGHRPSLYDRLIFDELIELRDVETGMPIVDSTANSQHPSVYDLQGRRLAAPPAKGIYVKDGRMVVAR